MKTEAKRALRIYMEFSSEENWCAGWLLDLEFELWEWVLKWRDGINLSPDEEANGDHWTKDAQALSWLAEQAGGGDGSRMSGKCLCRWGNGFGFMKNAVE